MDGADQSALLGVRSPGPWRQHPWIVVVVDEGLDAHPALVWALREAARREATVLAVHVLGDADVRPVGSAVLRDRPGAAPAHRDSPAEELEQALRRAVAETGIAGRTRTAVVDRDLLAALTGAARGADLVVVGSWGKTLLRRAPAPRRERLPARRD